MKVEQQKSAETKRAWVKPELTRLNAGAAENGTPSGNPDVGVAFS